MQTLHITTPTALRDFLRRAQPHANQQPADSASPRRILITAEALLGRHPFAGTRESHLDRFRRHRSTLSKLRQRVAAGDHLLLLVSNRDCPPSPIMRRWLREILPGLRLVFLPEPTDPATGAVPFDTIAPAGPRRAECPS